MTSKIDPWAIRVWNLISGREHALAHDVIGEAIYAKLRLGLRL